MKSNFEIEYRSKVSFDKYNELLIYLDENAQVLGQDDKNVFFFLLEDKLLKVSDNKSQGTAKITLKLNTIGNGATFEEIEFNIQTEDVKDAVRLFKTLGYVNVQESFQIRKNYIYEDVEIAMKYSETWGYHLELEKVIHDISLKESADLAIKKVADSLNIQIMSDEELKKFTIEHNKNETSK